MKKLRQLKLFYDEHEKDIEVALKADLGKVSCVCVCVYLVCMCVCVGGGGGHLCLCIQVCI